MHGKSETYMFVSLNIPVYNMSLLSAAEIGKVLGENETVKIINEIIDTYIVCGILYAANIKLFSFHL